MNSSPKRINEINIKNNEETLSRLKFLGHIQKEEKIDIRNVCRQPNNLITKIYRSVLYPDNRINALKFIKDVMSKTFDIINNCDKQDLCNIIIDVIKAQQGILNLKYTYASDTKFCCDIDVLVEGITSQLEIVKMMNNDIFEENKDNKENKEEC